MLALDLYCGAGGASMGLWRTGLFETIVGIDCVEQPDYPFDFVDGDIESVGQFGDEFELPDGSSVMPDFVWASPPCQQFANIGALNRHRNKVSIEEWNARHPDLIPLTRELVGGHEWTCIENIPPAPIRPDIVLEGGNVGIPNLARRRHFEVSWPTLSPQPHTIGVALVRAYGNGGWTSSIQRAEGRKSTTIADIQDAFDVDWCNKRKSLNEMIPPAYATYIVQDAVRHGFGS